MWLSIMGEGKGEGGFGGCAHRNLLCYLRPTAAAAANGIEVAMLRVR